MFFFFLFFFLENWHCSNDEVHMQCLPDEAGLNDILAFPAGRHDCILSAVSPVMCGSTAEGLVMNTN